MHKLHEFMGGYIKMFGTGFLRGFKSQKKLGIPIKKNSGKEKLGKANVSWKKLGKVVA